MGAEKSVPQGFCSAAYTAENYAPMGGFRPSNTNGVLPSAKPSTICGKVHNQKLLKLPSQAVWSVVPPVGETPCARSLHWFVHEPVKNRLYIGYGISITGEILNDMWAFDFGLQKWAPIPLRGEQIEPRSGTKAALFNNYIILFGGYNEGKYFGDFHIINLDTFEVSRPKTTGPSPDSAPRTACLIAAYEKNIFIWGGYANERYLSDLYVLNTSNLEWSVYNKDIKGRAAFSWVQDGSDIFLFGGAMEKSAGYLHLNCLNGEMSSLPALGVEVDTKTMNSSIANCGPFYALIGGKSQSKFSFIYGFHAKRKTWFLLNVVPDGETVTVEDGDVVEGIFRLPRNVSVSLVYSQEERTIYGFLGHPLSMPPPIMKLDVKDTISFVNLQDDMLDIFKSQM